LARIVATRWTQAYATCTSGQRAAVCSKPLWSRCCSRCKGLGTAPFFPPAPRSQQWH
jgi:hypothetical protein